MNHLTEEQFEDIMQGVLEEPEHLAGCYQCQERLAEKKALAARLSSAFNSVKADEQLAKKIRARLADKKVSKQVEVPKLLWIARLQRIAWPAAAAAVLVIVTIFGIYAISPSPAAAAQAELVKIYKHNISADHGFYSEADPVKLARYFKDRLGFVPSMPELVRGMSLRGCCVQHFLGEPAGSYVVETPRGVMSVVVVAEQPESFKMSKSFEHQGRVFWKSSFAKCNMVIVRFGDYSYCAMGEIPHEYLTELLSQLMSEK